MVQQNRLCLPLFAALQLRVTSTPTCRCNHYRLEDAGSSRFTRISQSQPETSYRRDSITVPQRVSHSRNHTIIAYTEDSISQELKRLHVLKQPRWYRRKQIVLHASGRHRHSAESCSIEIGRKYPRVKRSNRILR